MDDLDLERGELFDEFEFEQTLTAHQRASQEIVIIDEYYLQRNLLDIGETE